VVEQVNGDQPLLSFTLPLLLVKAFSHPETVRLLLNSVFRIAVKVLRLLWQILLKQTKRAILSKHHLLYMIRKQSTRNCRPKTTTQCCAPSSCCVQAYAC
jgi:hypothetical protein